MEVSNERLIKMFDNHKKRYEKRGFGMIAQARRGARAIGKQGIDLREYILHSGIYDTNTYKTIFVKEPASTKI